MQFRKKISIVVRSSYSSFMTHVRGVLDIRLSRKYLSLFRQIIQINGAYDFNINQKLFQIVT